MFQDLDTTLAELLKRELPRSLVDQVSISFATPDGQFPPSTVPLPAINLFLYEIQENRDYRGSSPIEQRQSDGRVLRMQPPFRLDCHYLVTAWPKTGVPQPEQDEHRILGEVMRVLLRYRELPHEVLRGSLVSTPVPLRAAVLQAAAQQTRGDFWQALGGKPKAAFNYTITMAIDVHWPEDIGHVATSVSG